MRKPRIFMGLSIFSNLAGEAIPLPTLCHHTLPATKCLQGIILCDYGLLEVEYRLTLFVMASTSGLKRKHYGVNRKEWPVVLSCTKAEALELDQLLCSVVDECEKIGATGGSRYEVLKKVLLKVQKQRERPILFLRN